MSLPFGVVALMSVLPCMVISALLLWNRFVDKNTPVGVWLFLIFPFSQSVLVFYLFSLVIDHQLGIHLFVFISALCIACIPTDLVLLRTLRQLSQRRLSLERAQMLSEQSMLQKLHYEDLLKDIEAAQEIRRIIAAELKKAYVLLDERKNIEASHHLEGTIETFTSHYRCFCQHHVVDALLAEKSKRCDKLGIHLAYALDIPESLPISGTELCAIFSNILDNALSACASCEPETRFIELKAHTAGGFFVLKTSNSACTAQQKRQARSRLSEHGWGFYILREIAARHGGELMTKRSQNVFQTVIWLKI